MQSYLVVLIPIIAASAAQLLLKRGLLTLGKLDFSLGNLLSLIPRILQNFWLVAGLILFGVSFLVYLFALSKYQLNIVYPIFVSAGVIIVSLSSWFFFKETLTLLQILGIVFIIFGIFLLATKG